MVSGLTFRSSILSCFFVYGVRQWPSFPSILYWRDCLFSVEYPWLLCCKLTISAWAYFWALCSVLLIYVSVFLLVLYYMDYCSFVVQLEIRKCLQLCCSFSGLLWLFVVFYSSIQFWSCVSCFFEICHWDFDRIAFILQIALGSVDILIAFFQSMSMGYFPFIYAFHFFQHIL